MCGREGGGGSEVGIRREGREGGGGAEGERNGGWRERDRGRGRMERERDEAKEGGRLGGSGRGGGRMRWKDGGKENTLYKYSLMYTH